MDAFQKDQHFRNLRQHYFAIVILNFLISFTSATESSDPINYTSNCILALQLYKLNIFVDPSKVIPLVPRTIIRDLSNETPSDKIDVRELSGEDGLIGLNEESGEAYAKRISERLNLAVAIIDLRFESNAIQLLRKHN
ncbi:hypothetical protein QAD02_016758 [Eretmocerus hayati]|uniref:Uncharacterized protein n=1 Tax=Eretmocerus hayati TaxID=131215 RepID=A0ACC2PD93_9HYME|nr:hypothetical protein QAD02_016758 [Eretmocerus hayati]